MSLAVRTPGAAAAVRDAAVRGKRDRARRMFAVRRNREPAERYGGDACVVECRVSETSHSRRLFTSQSYAPKKWDLSGLQGISDNTLAVHFGLYEGYVKNTNLLNEQIAETGEKRRGRRCQPALRRAFTPPRLRVQRHAAARILLREHDQNGRRFTGRGPHGRAGDIVRRLRDLEERLRRRRRHARRRLGDRLSGPVDGQYFEPLDHAARRRQPGGFHARSS